MNSDMIFDALRSLELRWRDAAVTFERFARSLPTGSDAPTVLLDPADDTSERPLADVIGLDGAAPAYSLLQRAVQEAKRLETALIDLLADTGRPIEALLSNARQPAGSPAGAVEIFQQSEAWSREVRTAAPGPARAPGFHGLFGATPPAGEALERASCRNRLDQLADFIARTLRGFAELDDRSGFTERFDGRSLRNSVDNLFAYPVLTSEVNGGPAGHRGGGGEAGTGTLKRSVTTTIREVLGRSPRAGDPRSFLAALNHSFTTTEEMGVTVVRWTPRTYSGQTDLGGGVTGGQASLFGRARVTLDNALPLLDGLYSLREDDDPELVSAARSIVRTELTEIVTELGTEGGPRTTRVDNLFSLLLVNRFTVLDPKVPSVAGHLGVLAHELGLVRARVNTLEEESNLTNFVALSDYVTSLRAGWLDFRKSLGSDLGTQFVKLSRALSVTAEAVDEVNEAMDSVFVGRAERQVATFSGADGQTLSVGDLLSWVTSFAAEEAPRMVQDGGRRGVEALVPTARLLDRSVELFLQALATDRTLSDGMRQPRVLTALRELRGHLFRIDALAGQLSVA
jgi:hypothetical protein